MEPHWTKVGPKLLFSGLISSLIKQWRTGKLGLPSSSICIFFLTRLDLISSHLNKHHHIFGQVCTSWGGLFILLMFISLIQLFISDKKNEHHICESAGAKGY